MKVGGDEGGERAMEMQQAGADRAYRCRLTRQGSTGWDGNMPHLHERCICKACCTCESRSTAAVMIAAASALGCVITVQCLASII